RRKDIAGRRKPALVAIRDRRAAETERDAMAVRPVGDLARDHDRASVFFTRKLYWNLEIDLLAPGARGRCNRQRRCNRPRGRGIKKLGIKRERAEVEADAWHWQSSRSVTAGLLTPQVRFTRLAALGTSGTRLKPNSGAGHPAHDRWCRMTNWG